jgi:hypothetical protein
MSGMKLHEVIGYGPIVYCSEDYGILITINGSYLNWWVETGNGLWTNTDCRSGHPDLYTLTVAKAMDLAEAWFNEVMEYTEEQDATGT